MANEHPKFEDDPNDHPSSLSHMFLSLALLAQRDSAAHISSANVLNKYAACGWAVVQMELDGGMTPVVWRWRNYVGFFRSAKGHQEG